MPAPDPALGWQWPLGDGDRLPPAPSPLDGIEDAASPLVRRVRVREHDAVDAVELLWEADATAVLHAFSCGCAERAAAWPIEPDMRSLLRRTAAAKRGWLAGTVDDESLEEAHARALEIAQAQDEASVEYPLALLAARVAWSDPVGTAVETASEAEHAAHALARARSPDAGEDAWVEAAEELHEALAAELERLLLALGP